MAKLLGIRFVRLVATLIAVSFLTFWLVNTLPGDPLTALIPPETQTNNPELVAQLREEFGLDDPLPVRYVAWLGDAVTGDLGRSTVTGRPVIDDITARMPVTFEIAAVAVIFSLLIAVPLGILSAYREGTKIDQGVSAFAQFGLSIPGFVTGLALIYVFAVKLQWLPATGWTRLTDSFTGNIKTVILPAASLALTEIAVYTRVVRSDMISTLQEDYIQFAKSKGLRDRAILFRHALRPSSLTLITIVGLNIGALLGGTLIVEVLFAVPGLGKRLLDAIFQRDFLVVQGITVFIATMYVLVNTIVDLLYIAVDPRIRK